MENSNEPKINDDAALDKFEEQLDRRRREGITMRAGDMAWSKAREVAVLKRRIARDQARLVKLEDTDAQN